MERNGFGGLGSSEQVNGKALKRASVVMLAVLAAGLFSVSGAQAAISMSGNVDPADPSTWTSSTNLRIGDTADGSVTADGGSYVNTSNTYLGRSVGSTGVLTVDGAGTTWKINSQRMWPGYSGKGILNITNGGTVNSSTTHNYIAYNNGSTGMVNVDGAGSSWVHRTLYVGYHGTATMNITNGGIVYSNANGNIGAAGPGYTGRGSVFVDGANSKWAITGALWVGCYAPGSLLVSNGGTVTTTASSYIGVGADSARAFEGIAIVDGIGSNLTINSNNLYVGYPSSTSLGRLSISDGGRVAGIAASINAVSTLTADVHSSLVVGAGTITNNGTIRLVAGAGAANGIYTPMSYGTMTGTGTVQALGGIWDLTNHTVTVSDASLSLSGRANTIDLSATQRVLFVDAATAQVAGASFLGAGTSTNLTLSASTISGSVRTSLQGLLGAGETILSGWDFNATEGYATGEPAYLSLFAGSGHSLYDLTVWHYDGSAWSKFDASDLAYDNTYASFTVTGLSGYAVSGTAPVPIPPAVFLFGSGLSGLFLFRRRKAQA